MRINQSEAYRMYIDYHCYGNTLHTTDEEMGYIVHEYSDYISRWKESVTNDNNKYEFDDSDFENWKADGEQRAKDSTGYKDTTGDSVVQHTEAIAPCVTGGAGALYAHATGGVTAVKDVAAGNFNWNSNQLPEGYGTNQTKIGDTVTAIMAIATYGAYLADKPNEEQVKACDDLLGQMEALQQSLLEYQAQMDAMAQEIAEAEEEAASVNDEANENMDTSKTEYDVFVASYCALVEKAKTQGLTDEERGLVEDLFAAISGTGEEINTTSEDAQTTVGDIYSDMGTYQEGYDEAAAGMAGVEGVTDFAEEFDERTQALCQVSAAGQAANSLSGAMSGAKLILRGASKGWLGVAQIILGGFAIAAGVGSGVAAKEQYDMSGQVGVEIDARTGTQDLNGNTMDAYDQSIDFYAGAMNNVENLELTVPDDVDAPTETVPDNPPPSNKPVDPSKSRFGKYTSK